jgi:signal transduction histidine kinase
LKITQKFLLFGLVPVIAQACICIQMFSQLRNVEFYAEQEAKQSLIARKLAEVISQSMEVAVATGSYAHYQVQFTAKYLQLASQRMESRLKELIDLAKDDPETLADVQQMATFGKDTKDRYMAITLPDYSEAHKNMRSMNDDAFKTGELFIHRVRRVTRMLEREGERLERTRQQSKAKRAEIKMLIWAELALCIGILILFYVVFRLDFGRKFNALLQNARDLAVDKPASQMVSGSDELSELSKALTDAAETRREATAQKQMLFQMVTHDLRSPLMAASVIVDTLLHDTSGAEEQRKKRLNNIERSLQQVVGLTNDLLTIEKLSAGGVELRRVKVDFRETIDQAIEIVQPISEKNQIQIANYSPSIICSVDEDRVLQVLVNLLSNSIKFSPAAALIDVTAKVEGKYLRVEVLDRGSGISEESLQKLFSPFQQGATGKSAAGFGLGLAISKLLVGLHGGEINANVRPGGGTIFWFTLAI